MDNLDAKSMEMRLKAILEYCNIHGPDEAGHLSEIRHQAMHGLRQFQVMDDDGKPTGEWI